jgi:RHS repeat-associated protein
MIASQQQAYEYDRNGLLKSIQDREGQRAFDFRPNMVQTLGSDQLVTDGMSRIVERRAFKFDYGPQGTVRTLRTATGSEEFLYDESGKILLTRGRDDAVHFGKDMYRAGKYLQPLMHGKQLIGWLENGIYRAGVSDFRGTPIFEQNAGLSLDPFGAGPFQSGQSESLHFAGHGMDEFSGLVRMGVRQYDSGLGMFMSPDPLFMESPESCISSPLECSLFSYGKNNPLSNTDPTGLYVEQDGTNHIGPANPKQGQYSNLNDFMAAKRGFSTDHERLSFLRKYSASTKHLLRNDDAYALKMIAEAAVTLTQGLKDQAKVVMNDLFRVVVGDGYTGDARGSGAYFAGNFKGSEGFRKELRDPYNQPQHAIGGLKLAFDYGALGEGAAMAGEMLQWPFAGAQPQDIRLYGAVFPVAESLKNGGDLNSFPDNLYRAISDGK